MTTLARLTRSHAEMAAALAGDVVMGGTEGATPDAPSTLMFTGPIPAAPQPLNPAAPTFQSLAAGPTQQSTVPLTPSLHPTDIFGARPAPATSAAPDSDPSEEDLQARLNRIRGDPPPTPDARLDQLLQTVDPHTAVALRDVIQVLLGLGSPPPRTAGPPHSALNALGGLPYTHMGVSAPQPIRSEPAAPTPDMREALRHALLSANLTASPTLNLDSLASLLNTLAPSSRPNTQEKESEAFVRGQASMSDGAGTAKAVSYSDAPRYADPMGHGRYDPDRGEEILTLVTAWAHCKGVLIDAPGALLDHMVMTTMQSTREAPELLKWLLDLVHTNPNITRQAFTTQYQARWISEVRTRSARARDRLYAGQVYMRPSMTLTEYIAAFRGVLTDIPDLAELDRVRLFHKGLTPAFQVDCACDLTGREFMTLDTLIQHALGVERKFSIQKATPGPSAGRDTKRVRFNAFLPPQKRPRTEPSSYAQAAAVVPDRPAQSFQPKAAGPSAPTSKLWVPKSGAYGGSAGRGAGRGGGRGAGRGGGRGGGRGAGRGGARGGGRGFAGGTGSSPPTTPQFRGPRVRTGDPNQISHIHYLDGRLLTMGEVWDCYDNCICFNCFERTEEPHRADKCKKPLKSHPDR